DPRCALHSFPTRRSSDLLTTSGVGSSRGIATNSELIHPTQPKAAIESAAAVAATLRRSRGRACSTIDSVFGGSTRDSMLGASSRSEEHTSELQSRFDLVC